MTEMSSLQFLGMPCQMSVRGHPSGTPIRRDPYLSDGFKILPEIAHCHDRGADGVVRPECGRSRLVEKFSHMPRWERWIGIYIPSQSMPQGRLRKTHPRRSMAAGCVSSEVSKRGRGSIQRLVRWSARLGQMEGGRPAQNRWHPLWLV